MLITKLKHGLVAGVLAAAAVGAGVGVSQVGGQEAKPTGVSTIGGSGPPGTGDARKEDPDVVPKEARPANAREARADVYDKEHQALAGGIWVAKAQTINGQPAPGPSDIRIQFYPAGTPLMGGGMMGGGPVGMPAIRGGPVGMAGGGGGGGLGEMPRTPLDTLIIKSDVLRFGRQPQTEQDEFLFKVNPFRTPKEITLSSSRTKEMTQFIYELKGEKLRLAGYRTPGEPDRPYGFDVKDQPNNGATLWVIELELQKLEPAPGGPGGGGFGGGAGGSPGGEGQPNPDK